MPQGSSSLAPLSAAASSARRLSLRSTEELLRQVLSRVADSPSELAPILDEHPDPLIAFTADRIIISANSAAERFFGYGRHELDGHITDVVVPERFRQPDAPPMKAFDTLTTVELPGLRHDGTEPSLSWTFGTIVVTEQQPVFVMVVRDRAEIDDALEALYASEQRFRFLVEGVRDHAIFLLDANGHVASWNAGAERIMGWQADEILGQHYATFFTDEDRAANKPAQNLAVSITVGRMHGSGWCVRKDGSRFFAEASLWPLHTHDGALQGFAKITHDLTAKKLAEEAQRKLDLERAAREASEAGRDRLARLHRVAQALSRATTREEVCGVVLTECLAEVDAAGGAVYLVSPDGRELRLLGEQGHPAILHERLQSIPLQLRTPAGDALRTMTPLFFVDADALVAAYPEHADGLRAGGFQACVLLPLVTRGSPFGVIGVRYRQHHPFPEADRSLLVTIAELCTQALERAKLFEAQMAARAEAEAASRAKDEFLAMLGHELRNPLAPIATAVQLMKLRGETHATREREVIERQLGHITRLVDDLLDISRITRGKLELAHRPLDVADVIARAVEMASPLFEQRHHQLSMQVERGLVVNGDPGRLAQIVSNLLSNAAKYTRPNGLIAIEARADAAEVVIQVRDNGEGIAAELLPQVFELFVQGKRTFDRAEGGLGIGLSLVKNLVTLHGGVVTATSPGTPGKGSEFTVRLPRLIQATAPDPANNASLGPGSAKGRKRVLVVDDNRDFAEMLTSMLGALGYDVTMAGDAVSALEVLRNFSAEAAVLDLGLPVLDGFELARKIREEFPNRTPRMIAVTGYGQQHDRERSADVGFADHLVKPIDINAMVAALERANASNQ